MVEGGRDDAVPGPDGGVVADEVVAGDGASASLDGTALDGCLLDGSLLDGSLFDGFSLDGFWGCRKMISLTKELTDESALSAPWRMAPTPSE